MTDTIDGRVNKNDHDYILAVRNLSSPNPNQKIDTPKEICKNLREEDFRHEYALNVLLVDYLLENKGTNTSRIKSVMQYVSENFARASDFFVAYFNTGKYQRELIQYLSKEWPGFGRAVVYSENGAEYLSYILRYVDADYISDKMNTDNVLTKFISEQGYLVLASAFQPPDNYDCVRKLNVRFGDLSMIEKNNELLKFAHDNSLYDVNPVNVNYILRHQRELVDANFIVADSTGPKAFDSEACDRSNFTSILSSGDRYLTEYVEKNLSVYVERVFLGLSNNTQESEEAIKRLINYESLEDSLKEKIISKQKYVFGTFEGIPESLWAHLLLEEKIATTWENISKFISDEESDKKIVTELLSRQNVVDTLSTLKFSIKNIGEENSKLLSGFILNNAEIDDLDYSRLIRQLPYVYLSFPSGISKEKTMALAKVGRVKLTEKSFSYATNDYQLAALLIEKNFGEYVKEKEKYPTSDDVREILLSSGMSLEEKIAVCQDVSPSGISKSKKLCMLVADVITSTKADYSMLQESILTAAIAGARTIEDSIRILTRCLPNWSEGKVMDALAGLQDPFSEISIYGKRPKLENSEVNALFAQELEKKGFVSSVVHEDNMIKINTFKSSDHAEQ